MKKKHIVTPLVCFCYFAGYFYLKISYHQASLRWLGMALRRSAISLQKEIKRLMNASGSFNLIRSRFTAEKGDSFMSVQVQIKIESLQYLFRKKSQVYLFLICMRSTLLTGLLSISWSRAYKSTIHYCNFIIFCRISLLWLINQREVKKWFTIILKLYNSKRNLNQKHNTLRMPWKSSKDC